MCLNKVKVEVLGENEEVDLGITVKAGNKYYIISKSPFNEEVMVFGCDKNGHCSKMTDLWTGCSFEEAKEFLANNQP